MNTWGIIVEEQMINVNPLNYRISDVNNRENICATIMDIPVEVEESEFTSILNKTEARY